MVKRTEHGGERHEEAERPTSEAEKDKTESSEIYFDVESLMYIFVGAKGRTHIFTSEVLHHTSFRTTKMNRSERVKSGKWEIIHRTDLPDELK
ncbi:MAG: hypothetical protein ACR2J3_04520 [Aridibacter sp.]